MDNTPTEIKTQIQTNIKDSLKRINKNLTILASGFGKFTYPGTGELRFGQPRIGDHGNIFADVDYLP